MSPSQTLGNTPHRVREEVTCPEGLARWNMPHRSRKGEACPTGLGRGKHAQ